MRAAMKYLIGIDIGTTNLKVGVCSETYELLQLYTMPTPRKKGGCHGTVYDSKEFKRILLEMVEQAAREYPPSMIAITSMAEAGAFVDEESGEVVSDLIPWQDLSSGAYVTEQDRLDEKKRFMSTGLHVAYKYSVFKVLAYKAQNGSVCGLKFLPAASLAAYFLTGRMVTDITLAARTYACDIMKRQYDKEYLEHKEIPASIFPEITDGYAGKWKRLKMGNWDSQGQVKVFVAGHDHVCASVAAGISAENREVFLSLGTTGAAMGCIPAATLTERDFASGYAFGRHPREEQMTWLGAIQSAGASIDWAMKLVGADKGEYKVFEDRVQPTPEEILYFPYINGSGPPRFNSGARGAFIGLSVDTAPENILAAVMQGISFEIRWILENTGRPLPARIKAVGGCTENRCLMQMMADIMQCEIAVPVSRQSALVGAVMAGCKSYCQSPLIKYRFLPRDAGKKRYSRLYQEYLRMQPMILDYRRIN